jgi:high-affinity iron transporter
MFFNSIFRNQFKFKCAKMEKSKKIGKMKKVQYPIVIILASLILINAFVTYSSCNYRLYALATNATVDEATTTTTKFNDTAALFLMINFERMRTQLMLAEQSLPVDKDLAFLHAYVIHSIIFPSIKNLLEKTAPQSANELLSTTTDLAFTIKTGNSPYISKDLTQARNDLNGTSNELINPILQSNKRASFLAETASFLLNDANKSYSISGAGESTNQGKPDNFDYQNAVGLVNASKTDFNKISNSTNKDKESEINQYYDQLQSYVINKFDTQSVSRSISEMQNDLTSYYKSSSNGSTNPYTHYFSTIRNDLQSVIKDVKNGNYDGASDTVITAYLDNFEYLEPSVDKFDHNLKLTIELGIREHLRQMLDQKAPYSAILSYINYIFLKLSQAEKLLDSHLTNTTMISSLTTTTNGMANIQGLNKGFGTYTGVRHSMGQATETSKGSVRGNIDQIRLKLLDMLSLYKKGSYDDAFSTARSAYLDNYENIELPLRPVNPDFTLDMEIKFAELRNLIETKVPYDKVQDKVFEIRQGLDESERLVSGTGVIAPTIAFSTSFSIFFREGLEATLIIVAILTYLEASRNERFKKHVYYGIVIAIAATGITWFIAQYMIEISGANRELIEAIASLSAVAVLFWVSFWVLNKIETKKWIEFVKAKIWKATITGSLLVFVMLSFFTVYREGFETVLFYQALLSFAKYMEWYVVAGLISGLALILGMAYIMRKVGKKLPLRLLFGVTMGVGAYMSIAFMGNAVRSLQEIGYVPTTPLFGIIPRLDINVSEMTGIHPTLETFVAQVILLGIYLAGSLYILVIQPKRKRKMEMARKSISDIQSNDPK